MPNSADHLLLPVLLSREEVVVLLGPLVETWLKRRSEAGVEIEWRGERSGWNRRKKGGVQCGACKAPSSELLFLFTSFEYCFRSRPDHSLPSAGDRRSGEGTRWIGESILDRVKEKGSSQQGGGMKPYP